MTKLLRINFKIILIFLFSLSGCATARPLESAGTLRLAGGEPQIEFGRPNFVIDGLGNILSLPKKVIMLNFKIDSHSISQDTVAAIETYIKDNFQLTKDTKVRVNQFPIMGEFKRLAKNKKISWWWRVFPGIPVTLFSLSGRLFGGDHYNPYTDTVNLYSNCIPVALHELGHAADIQEKVKEGWADYYAVGRIFPPVVFYQEYEASQRAIDYLDYKQDQKEQNNAYRVLIPAYGTYAGSYSGLPYGDAVGALAGHIISIVPRYNNNLAHQAKNMAVWSDEAVLNFENDPLAQSLIEEREKEIEFNNFITEEAKAAQETAVLYFNAKL